MCRIPGAESACTSTSSRSIAMKRFWHQRPEGYVLQAMPVQPVKMTTIVKLVLDTMVTNKKPLWTTAIADLADLPPHSVQNVLSRLQEAGWVTSEKETREQASERKAGARRFWTFTEDGSVEAQKVVEHYRSRAARRA